VLCGCVPTGAHIWYKRDQGSGHYRDSNNGDGLSDGCRHGHNHTRHNNDTHDGYCPAVRPGASKSAFHGIFSHQGVWQRRRIIETKDGRRVYASLF
jgi:hypothetical protein